MFQWHKSVQFHLIMYLGLSKKPDTPSLILKNYIHTGDNLLECFTLVTASVFPASTVFQKKTTSFMGVRQHQTGNNIPCYCSHALMAVNLAFAVSPLHGNPTLPYCTLHGPWNPIVQNPKSTCPLHCKQGTSRNTVDGKPVSSNCVCCCTQTVFYIQEMSVGLLPHKYSTSQASDLPRGTFTSFCTYIQWCWPWKSSPGAFPSLSIY